MKIALFEIEAWERMAFEPLADGHEVVFVETALTADTAKEYADAEALLSPARR